MDPWCGGPGRGGGPQLNVIGVEVSVEWATLRTKGEGARGECAPPPQSVYLGMETLLLWAFKYGLVEDILAHHTTFLQVSCC